MTRILFVLPAQTTLDSQNRVMGWRSTPALRERVKELKALTPRLKELGAERVISSDLDNQSGWTIARQLGVKCEEWHSLRRFNYGKRHGISKGEAVKLLLDMQEKWEQKPDVPVPNGDSKTSYKNRMASAKEKISKQNGVSAIVVVAGEMELGEITGIRMDFEHNRIYQWEPK